MTKDLKLHQDTVTIEYVEESKTKKLVRDNRQRWVIGALRDGDCLNERYLSFSTTNALHASICERGKATAHSVLVKWRYSPFFDADLLWCELAARDEAVSA